MLRAIVLAALIAISLAAAGGAEAKVDKEKLPDRGPPAHANARAFREVAPQPEEPAPALQPEPDAAPAEAKAEAAPPAPPAAHDAPSPALGEEPSMETHVANAAPEKEGLAVAMPELASTAPSQLAGDAEDLLPFPPTPAALAATSLQLPTAAPDGGWPHALLALPLMGAVGAVLLVSHRARRGTSAPPTDVREALLRGKAALDHLGYAEALACFDRALELAPGLGVAHFCRGVCLAATGRAAEAYAALRESVEDDPTDGERRVLLARAALALGRTKEAMDELERIARDVPEAADAMLGDPSFAALRDHPRFLAMCGAL